MTRGARGAGRSAVPWTFCVLLAAAASAQDAPTTRPETPLRRSLDSWSAGTAVAEIGGDEDPVAYFVEEVRFRAGDLFFRADNAVVWFAAGARAAFDDAPSSRPVDVSSAEGRALVRVPDAARRFVREVYVDGVVLVMQGEETTVADAAYFDFERDRALIVDARTSFAFSTPDPSSRLYLRADELRMLAADRFEAVGVRASTCGFGKPHYHVSSDFVELWRSRNPAVRRRRLRRGSETFESRPPSNAPNLRYTASGNVLHYGDAPVFWFPDVEGESGAPGGQSTRHLKDVRLGSSGEFGVRGGVTVGSELVDETGEAWADWGVLLDYRSKRGFGGGVDFAYDRDGSRGYAHVYYQRDHGVDRDYGKPDTKNRGRISVQHRQALPWELQLDLEANLFSDRNFYPTYYEDEFRHEKPPETYAYLKRAFERSAATALFSYRTNNFDTVVERRPSFDYVLVSEPLVDLFDRPLYYSVRAEASSLRLRTDDDLGVPNRSTSRVDVDQLLEYAFDVGPVVATPFAGLRTTYYEEDALGRGDRFRDGFTYGVELSTQAWRSFDVAGGIFGLDGIRHVVRPSVEYRRTTGVDLGPKDLVPYDDVDAFGDREEVTFELRNLFQTVRRREDGPAVDEFLDLDWEITWFPDADRDNLGEPWGPLRADNVVRFSDSLQFLTDFEYRFSDGSFDVFNAAIAYAPSPDLQTYVGIRTFDESYDLVFGQVNARLSEKWLARLYASYDFERGESSDYELGLVRIGHDFVFEVYVRFDFGSDDESLHFALTPRTWFDATKSPSRSLGSEPRIGRIHDGFAR